MKKRIFLNPKEEINLPMILDQFVEEGSELIWSILDVDLFGDFESAEYLFEMTEQVMRRKDMPVFLTWDEVYEMAKRLTVIIDLNLIGCKDKEAIQEIYTSLFKDPKKDTYPIPEDILPKYEILVDVDDGDLRAVLSRDKRIQERCLKEFGPYPVGVYRDLTNE